jgi:hypothetical protein
MSMPLPGEIRYPSTAAHREMRWEREHRAIHVSEVTHRTYRDFRRTWGSRCSPCGAGSPLAASTAVSGRLRASPGQRQRMTRTAPRSSCLTGSRSRQSGLRSRLVLVPHHRWDSPTGAVAPYEPSL